MPRRLEQMRQTVDERLTATLEKRLGESFSQVSERLEAVHKGLGEMQQLAAGVGDLKRVLTNVKTRGTWGEVQLGALLEQVLTPDQYEANVVCKPGSCERVEFAIRLPGQGGDDGAVWLPIDAKFPLEDYQRMLEAQALGDAGAMDSRSQGAREPREAVRQGHPGQVPRPAAHHRLRHHVPAHRGALRRSPAAPGPGRHAAERVPGHRRRADHAWRLCSTACRWGSALLR